MSEAGRLADRARTAAPALARKVRKTSPMRASTLRDRARRRARTRGSSFVEYLVVLTLVIVVFSAAIVALGPVIVEEYQLSRNSIASPYP